MVSDRSQLTCTTGNFPTVTLFNCACVNDLSFQNFRGKIHENKITCKALPKKPKILTGSECSIKMSMAKTVEEVKGQKKGLREAARMYSVPTTSLKCRVDTGLLSEAKPGPST